MSTSFFSNVLFIRTPGRPIGALLCRNLHQKRVTLNPKSRITPRNEDSLGSPPPSCSGTEDSTAVFHQVVASLPVSLDRLYASSNPGVAGRGAVSPLVPSRSVATVLARAGSDRERRAAIVEVGMPQCRTNPPAFLSSSARLAPPLRKPTTDPRPTNGRKRRLDQPGVGVRFPLRARRRRSMTASYITS